MSSDDLEAKPQRRNRSRRRRMRLPEDRQPGNHGACQCALPTAIILTGTI